MAEVPLPTPTQVPVPSTDIRNVVFAGAKLDEEVTGSGEYYTDRLGVNRLTNTGRNNQFNAAQADKEARFQQFLLSSGYVFLGDYEDGPFQFGARNQYIQYNNQYYRLNAATDVGFTTTGTDATSFANDVTHFVLMDGDTLRQNLGSGEEGMGISLTALRQGGNGQNLAVFVSPQMKNANPYTNFGAATMAAFTTAMNMGIGAVYIPAGVYALEKTVEVSLSTHMSIIFDPGVIIYVDSPMDVFDININGFHLNIQNNNARIMSRWGSADGSQVAAWRLTDASLDKTLTAHSLKVGTADNISKFGYAVYGSGLNLPVFNQNLLQSVIGIHLDSPITGSATAHAMGAQLNGCEIYTDKEGVEVFNRGGLGAEGLLIFGGEIISQGTAIRVTNSGLDSNSYLPPLVRIIGMHINAYQALYAKDVSRVDFALNDVQGKYSSDVPINGFLELGGVQQFSHIGNKYTAIKIGTNTTGADCPSPVYQFASTLTNAYFSSEGNIYQLDAMTRPVFGFEGLTNTTTVFSGDKIRSSAGTWVAPEFISKIRLSPDAAIGNTGASAGLNYSVDASFANGVLTLLTSPVQGFTYNIGKSIVPDGATITQIISHGNLVGKEVAILLSAAAVNFTHGANMICPDQKPIKMNLPNVVRVFVLNTVQCRITDIGGETNRHTDITSAPTSAASSGYVGAEYYDSSTGRYYKYFETSGFSGWRYINTVAVGS
ncbi:hypothetical protein AAHU43_19670 [Klebsiella variicola subsp. variicola]|uniref:hypothetical protein n=1 Tax=Klebsiella variicola TaxID=244366 RepID=UPI0035A02B4D